MADTVETGRRMLKRGATPKDLVSRDAGGMVVKNAELANLIDGKLAEVAKSGANPQALDVDVTIRW